MIQTKHYQRSRKRRDIKRPALVHRLCRDVKADRKDEKEYPGQYAWFKLLSMLLRLGVKRPNTGSKDLPF